MNNYNLDLSEIIPKVKPLLKTNLTRIVFDLVLSCLTYYIFLTLGVATQSLGLTLCFGVLAGVAFFRCLVFMHEAYHLKEKASYVNWLYDLLFGFFNKMPSFIYTPHNFHHLKHTYGTKKDPEYEGIAHQPAYRLLLLPVIFLVIPVFYFVRHGILPLLMPILPRNITAIIWGRMSTFAMNMEFLREAPTQAERGPWIFQETATLLVNICMIVLCFFGILPIKFFLVWYIAFYTFYLINYYRVIVSHKYLGTGAEFSFQGQMLDSITIPKDGLIYQLFFPLGLQYHAIHHLFPTAPYFNLARIHKVLMKEVSTDHPYRDTVSNGYFTAVGSLLRDIRKNLGKMSPEQVNLVLDSMHVACRLYSHILTEITENCHSVKRSSDSPELMASL